MASYQYATLRLAGQIGRIGLVVPSVVGRQTAACPEAKSWILFGFVQSWWYAFFFNHDTFVQNMREGGRERGMDGWMDGWGGGPGQGD
eukprot:358565-Chlamydomonas_euryale.AAC.5